MRRRTWKILDWGDVPPDTPQTIPWGCPCGYQAALPVLGRVISIGGGADGDQDVVFDRGPHALPTTIQCRACRKVLTTTPAATQGG